MRRGSFSILEDKFVHSTSDADFEGTLIEAPVKEGEQLTYPFLPGNHPLPSRMNILQYGLDEILIFQNNMVLSLVPLFRRKESRTKGYGIFKRRFNGKG